MRIKVLAFTALLAIVLSLIPAGAVTAASMSPAMGIVGLEVTITGLTEGNSYKIKWDAEVYKQGVVGSGGSVFFIVPDAYGGEHPVIVESPSGTQAFSGNYIVVPNITIDPNSGKAGTDITVSGHGFGVSEDDIAVTYDGTVIKSGISADENGSWTTTFTAPISPRGARPIDASGDTTKGTDVADKNFTISPVVEMDPTSGGVGTQVTIKATGFASAEGGIKVLFSDKEVRSNLTAEVNGSWSTSFAVPPSTRGGHIVKIQGNTTAASDLPDKVFTVGPAININPNSGAVEDKVKVSGTGFANNETAIEVTFDGKTIERNLLADDNGSWSVETTVPPCGSGPHNIGAYGRITPSVDVTPAVFTTQAVLTIVPKSGNVKDELRVTGSGFNAGKDYSIMWDGTSVASGSVNDSGSFQSIFKAPGGKSGSLTITATDTKGSTASTTFMMESTAPDTPQISSPKDGATVGFMGDTKIAFKWTEESDPSGITYDLEVSEGSNFAKTLVSHTKLADAKYTLTEAEALPNGEYYWRVRAVDGAGNASDWTSATLVKVGFMTTNTLVFIAIGIVVLLILIIVLPRVLKKKRPKSDWE
ncbi:MAG: IPT/TIG domain-containing protein [Dehalococcoidia bacterium]